MVLQLGKAIGRTFQGEVAIATDARDSAVAVRTALASGIMSSGCDVVDLGLLPTPALQHYVSTHPGVSGGVMEAALRFAYQAVTGQRPESWDFKQVRGLKGMKEYTVTINGIELRLAVVHGAKRFDAVCEEVRAGKSPYHFIEFMACPGGCVCGGGQPLMPTLLEYAERKASSLYGSLRKRLADMNTNA